jgi:hypothetical protein
MPVEVNYVDTFQTRFFQSFVNLTKQDSTKYPALTTVRYDTDTNTGTLTSYSVYDQFALRVWTDTAPLTAK